MLVRRLGIAVGAGRPIDWLVDLTLSLLAVWLEFWRSTEPDQPEPAHEGGATEEFAADLHDWNTDTDTARFRQLYDATVISGDPDLTDQFPRIDLEGWSLCGSLTDQLPGA